MKDIMKKLAELEATAPKVTKKKMLNEDSTTPPMNVSNKAATLKDMFEMLSETVQPGQKPLPVMDPQRKQAGMGFVTSDNPAIQNMLKNLDPKDVQIVQAPGQQSVGQPSQSSATGQPQQGQQQMRENDVESKADTIIRTVKSRGRYGFEQLTDELRLFVKNNPEYKIIKLRDHYYQIVPANKDAVNERDEGKPGKNFAKIAKSAGERYGSKAAGERVAGAVRAKLAKQGKLEEEHDYSDYEERNMLDDLYDMDLPKPGDSVTIDGRHGIVKAEVNQDRYGGPAEFEVKYDDGTVRLHSVDTILNGDSSYDEDFIDEGAKVDRMVKHIAKSERKLGKSKDEAEDIAWATANKRGMLDNKNKKKTNEDVDQEIADIRKTINDRKGRVYTPNHPEKKETEQLKRKLDKLVKSKKKTNESSETEYRVLGQYDAKTSKGYDTRPVSVKVKAASEKEAKELAKQKLASSHKNYRPTKVETLSKKVEESQVNEIFGLSAKEKNIKLVQQWLKTPSNGAAWSTGSWPEQNKTFTAKPPASGVTIQGRLEGDDTLMLNITGGNPPTNQVVRYKLSDPKFADAFNSITRQFVGTFNQSGVGRAPSQNQLGAYKLANEADIAPTNGIDTKGAGLGAGRSATTLEGKWDYPTELTKKPKEISDMGNTNAAKLRADRKAFRKAEKAKAHTELMKGGKKVEEGKKPDFLDLDKDGNKKEPMKKAAADKKKKKVDESMNHRISAARLEGKSHGLRGHAHCGKSYEDLDEMKAYHEGYKEGLDESYGLGMYEDAMPATVPGMAQASMPAMEDEMEEGNAFTAALARTPKGGRFSVGGRSFTDRTGYDAKIDEYAFESLDKQLNALLSESLTISVTKGQENSPNSVSISAQDAEADQLLQLVKHAGLGLFGDDETPAEPSSAMSIQPSHGDPDEVGSGGADIEVVDGSDGMLSLMQKLSGVETSGANDYSDEEGGCDCEEGNCNCDEETNEDTCMECGGMMEAGHDCGSKEMVDEVESEDEMEYEVAEDNAPDSDEEETSADEDAEAKEDAALAGEKEEEMNESFASILERLSRLAEGSGDKPKHPEHDKKDDKDFDDAEEDEEDVTESEDLNEWANQAGKGPGKGTDASFKQDIEFMTKVISGGLNKPKSTGQTTVPVIAGQDDRMHDNPNDWAALAGIRKA